MYSAPPQSRERAYDMDFKLQCPWWRTSPFGPYFAVTYATELAPWRTETTVMVPGVFMKGTNHFANAGKLEDGEVAAEYLDGSL